MREWFNRQTWKVCVSQGTEGSNPSLSVTTIFDIVIDIQNWRLVGIAREGFESRSATARGGVANFFSRKRFVTESLVF